MTLSVSSFAADRYVVRAPLFSMVGDPDLRVEITPLTAQEVDPTPHLVEFLGLSSGMLLEPLPPATDFTVAGPTLFRLVLRPGLSERRGLLRVQQKGHRDHFGVVVFNIEKMVSRFSLVPLGTHSPRVGTPFPFELVALDAEGAVVSSYHNEVDLALASGTIQNPRVAGDLFRQGRARVELSFLEGDPLRMNRLDARASTLYPGQTEVASGSVDLMILPETVTR